MLKTTNEELRWLVSDHDTIVAIHTSPTCEICIELLPKFDETAKNAKYGHILFVELNAMENPIIEKVVTEKHAPYLSVYCKGIMSRDSTITDEEGFTQLLNEVCG